MSRPNSSAAEHDNRDEISIESPYGAPPPPPPGGAVGLPWQKPGTEPREMTIFVGRLDGSAITIAAAARAPDDPAVAHSTVHADDGPEDEPDNRLVVRLRIAPAGPGLAASTDLEADEVRRVVGHLVALDSAPRHMTGAAGARAPWDVTGGHSADEHSTSGRGSTEAGESGTRITVVTAEGTTAGALRHALASVPAGARLRDFSTDTEIVLVFEENWR